jgi:hypothetical protein
MSRVDTERPCAVSVSIYLALDMPVKAFVSLMKEKQNCHASISDPRCNVVTVSDQVVLITQATNYKQRTNLTLC